MAAFPHRLLVPQCVWAESQPRNLSLDRAASITELLFFIRKFRGWMKGRKCSAVWEFNFKFLGRIREHDHAFITNIYYYMYDYELAIRVGYSRGRRRSICRGRRLVVCLKEKRGTAGRTAQGVKQSLIYLCLGPKLESLKQN